MSCIQYLLSMEYEIMWSVMLIDGKQVCVPRGPTLYAKLQSEQREIRRTNFACLLIADRPLQAW